MNNELLDIDSLDGHQFEDLVARIMRENGYKNIIVLKSHDKGRDIVMEGEDGGIVVVECKHQHNVGRPVIQKLQGALDYEQLKQVGKPIQGMVVTSGKFSQEAIEYRSQISHKITFIDGQELQELCTKLQIVILNGKVQIITQNAFKPISNDKAKEIVLAGYSKISGHEHHKIKTAFRIKYLPAYFYSYSLNFNTYTTIGCVDKYNSSGKITIDGTTGKPLTEDLRNFYFSRHAETEDISTASEKVPFTFTAESIDDVIARSIIKQHTHTVDYVGDNQVSYTKTCTPQKKDISVEQSYPVYLPLWETDISLNEAHYKQQFYSRGTTKEQLFILDELRRCRSCSKTFKDYGEMSLCLVCAKIVCSSHGKIDYLDKKTPVCNEHAKSVLVLLENKYFAYEENRGQYKKWLSEQNFFRKLIEDRIVLGILIAALCICIGWGILLLTRTTTKATSAPAPRLSIKPQATVRRNIDKPKVSERKMPLGNAALPLTIRLNHNSIEAIDANKDGAVALDELIAYCPAIESEINAGKRLILENVPEDESPATTCSALIAPPTSK